MAAPLDQNSPCPCQSGQDYGVCCGPIHSAGGAGLGTTAEQLMRARYSAYVRHDDQFLLASWHPETRPAKLSFSSGHHWHGLSVLASSGGGGLEKDGTVEFKARFQRGSEHFELHELSSFAKLGGKWLYVDGYDPDSR